MWTDGCLKKQTKVSEKKMENHSKK